MDEKGEAKPAGRTNHRNGTSRKRIATDDDLLDVEIPRDREGTFDPVMIAKGERRFSSLSRSIGSGGFVLAKNPIPTRIGWCVAFSEGELEFLR
ncbi:mutator family transposase [Burkholderia sp. 132550021-2]|uniref:Mutator family transposase n=1 Tax=Burkholderia contaminans TaxID=488447 RepID=A0A250L589_9BURK|nr:hypothetical protein BCCH1_21530 [Burkholderia contaminans]GLZ69504.1 hypothetical protein Bcon01_25490 [Burkholderia contaminans]